MRAGSIVWFGNDWGRPMPTRSEAVISTRQGTPAARMGSISRRAMLVRRVGRPPGPNWPSRPRQTCPPGRHHGAMHAPPAAPRALVFDVFGTCTDWRGSVMRELGRLGAARQVQADWSAFADEWRRDGYINGIARIRAGQMPYVGSDVLFRRKLDELLPKYGVTGLSDTDIKNLAHAW